MSSKIQAGSVLFFMLLFFFPRSASCQVVTLDEAIKKGVENNRQLKLSSYKVALAAVKYKEAADLTFPSLKASAGYTRLSDVDEPKIQFPGAPEPVALFPVYVNNYAAEVCHGVAKTFTGSRKARCFHGQGRSGIQHHPRIL
jgi:hypothetical protein